MNFSSILIASVSVAACASFSTASTDIGGCTTNFAASGSFLSGKQYKTSADLPDIAPDAAFKKAYITVAKHGYQITQSDKEVGSISAAQEVSYSKGGKTAPLNLIVEAAPPSGSKISFSFSTAGGLMASGDTVRDEFCKIASEVASQ